MIVDLSCSKVKGLNPLQIYNIETPLSSILTIIFYIFFIKSHNVHRFTDSQIHAFTGVGVMGLRPIGPIGLRYPRLIDPIDPIKL